MFDHLVHPWQLVATTVHVLLAMAVSCHVVLHKRNSRAAVGWLGFIWVVPVAGSLIYLWIGVNRIERRLYRRLSRAELFDEPRKTILQDEPVEGITEHLRPLVRLAGEVTGRPLLEGNSVDLLLDGDEAYPAMLAAIDGATTSIGMCTYIFEGGPWGRRFVDALSRAADRGVAVRVLVDDIGARYSRVRTTRLLAEAGVPVVTFLPTLQPRWFQEANLRNHRKLLLVDGRVGFTGGINIRERHCRSNATSDAGTFIRDVQFRFAGPVVRQMTEAFAVDWRFANDETLEGETWFPECEPAGTVLARGIPDGPDEDLDKIERVLLGAIGCARRSIAIASPYFVPDEILLAALTTAALRGVEVTVVVPRVNNLPVVRWASMHALRELVENRCRVHESAPPFDHSKLFVVDEKWSLVGSANWDDRSLRLNFEFDVECHDNGFARSISELIRSRLADSRELTPDILASRSWFVRLRDGVARLASPYL